MPRVLASGYQAIFFVFYSPHLSAYIKDSIMSVSGKELKIEKRPKKGEERTEGRDGRKDGRGRVRPRDEAPACCREIPKLLPAPYPGTSPDTSPDTQWASPPLK